MALFSSLVSSDSDDCYILQLTGELIWPIKKILGKLFIKLGLEKKVLENVERFLFYTPTVHTWLWLEI